ncbi:MAG TPA: M56 family metallopeptidase, partial [Rhizomicrobium sp.]
MAGLNSWLSPAVLHALGWALIHSLWQCAAVGALAALAMAFMRRPALRYLVGVGALALMLAAPVATLLVLMKPAAPVQMLQPRAASVLPATPHLSTPVAVFATADRAIGAIAGAPRQLPDMLPWLVAAWACGVAFFSLRFAGGFLLLEHRRRTQSHAPGEHVLALCLDLQNRLGLDRVIQYLECAWVEAPAVIGWLRPAVLLPVFALTGLSEEQFRAVIAH